MTAQELINHLQLLPHPEGGFYKEVYRSTTTIAAICLPPSFAGERHCCTSIFYLLQAGDYSAFHRIKSDEIWHFYAGGNLVLHLIDGEGRYERILLGNALDQGARFQYVMPAGVWFASEPAEGTAFALAGCTVSPGFDFRDFEMAKRDALLSSFPQHREMIERLTR